ncbi:MAG: hypothetical protein ACK50J_17160, partial [Planctomyces sp.]
SLLGLVTSSFEKPTTTGNFNLLKVVSKPGLAPVGQDFSRTFCSSRGARPGFEMRSTDRHFLTQNSDELVSLPHFRRIADSLPFIDRTH